MERTSILSGLKEEILGGYRFLFTRTWPDYLAGIIIAIMVLMILLWNGMWSISGGYRNWGDWFFYLIGLGGKRPLTPWMDPFSVTNLALFTGALASALLSRQFAVRRAPSMEYGKGLIGGILMGAGAALAGGCNVGGFYSAIGVFSMGGYTIGIFHPFWLGSLLGGTIFGLGMLLAGGCASNTLWRLAEGRTKLGMALVSFALTNAASIRFIETYDIRHYLGKGLFLPGVLSWQLGLPFFMAVLLLWTLMAAWNEKTEKPAIF